MSLVFLFPLSLSPETGKHRKQNPDILRTMQNDTSLYSGSYKEQIVVDEAVFYRTKLNSSFMYMRCNSNGSPLIPSHPHLLQTSNSSTSICHKQHLELISLWTDVVGSVLQMLWAPCYKCCGLHATDVVGSMLQMLWAPCFRCCGLRALDVVGSVLQMLWAPCFRCCGLRASDVVGSMLQTTRRNQDLDTKLKVQDKFGTIA